jgi:hypothetical protein
VVVEISSYQIQTRMDVLGPRELLGDRYAAVSSNVSIHVS